MCEISKCGNNSLTDWAASPAEPLELLQADADGGSCDATFTDLTLSVSGFLTCRASTM